MILRVIVFRCLQSSFPQIALFVNRTLARCGLFANGL